VTDKIIENNQKTPEPVSLAHYESVKLDANAKISALQGQRNFAMDQAATLQSELAAANFQIQGLSAALAKATEKSKE